MLVALVAPPYTLRLKVSNVSLAKNKFGNWNLPNNNIIIILFVESHGDRLQECCYFFDK